MQDEDDVQLAKRQKHSAMRGKMMDFAPVRVANRSFEKRLSDREEERREIAKREVIRREEIKRQIRQKNLEEEQNARRIEAARIELSEYQAAEERRNRELELERQREIRRQAHARKQYAEQMIERRRIAEQEVRRRLLLEQKRREKAIQQMKQHEDENQIKVSRKTRSKLCQTTPFFSPAPASIPLVNSPRASSTPPANYSNAFDISNTLESHISYTSNASSSLRPAKSAESVEPAESAGFAKSVSKNIATYSLNNKTPFINLDKVEKRPLSDSMKNKTNKTSVSLDSTYSAGLSSSASIREQQLRKNIYKKSILAGNLNKTKNARNTVIVEDRSKGSGISLAIAITLMIILGTIVGTFVYFAFFQ